MKGNASAAGLDLHNGRHRRVLSCWIFFCTPEKMSFDTIRRRKKRKIREGEALVLRGQSASAVEKQYQTEIALQVLLE